MKRCAFTLALALFALGAAPGASAHEARPGSLEIRQSAVEIYETVWKVPARGEMRLSIHPRFPENCKAAAEPTTFLTGDSYNERSTLSCQGGLVGTRIFFDGLSATLTDVLVRVTLLDGAQWSVIVRPAQPWLEFTGSKGFLEVGRTYALHGIQHILFGIDHLLFVFGLLIIVQSRWMLVKTVTSFTIAHSITLAIATLGYARAPVEPLNAAIALSILFLGPEIVRSWRGETSLTLRHPWFVAFVFGLLHGFGFASAMTGVGLAPRELPVALLSFNVGVEIGQVAFVLLVVLLERSLRQLEVRWPRWVELTPGYAVGSLGAFWTLQRVAVMLG